MQLLNRWAISALLVAAALLTATIAFADSHYGNDDSNARDIDVQLTGSQQVPSVSTDTTGRYWLEFDDDGGNMDSRLDVYDGDEITAAHLHCGSPGENGPAVVTLFNDSSGVDIDGQLDSSSISDGDISDANCASRIGYDIDDVQDLARAVNDGDIYVNVHSQSHPDGLIRGNLPASSNDDDDDRGHDWKDDDRDGKDDWYKDRDGNWKDSCKDWDDHDGNGKHDWSDKDWDSWNREFGDKDHDSDGKGGWQDDQHDEDWKNDNQDWKDEDNDWNDDHHKDWNKDENDDHDGNHDWKHSDDDGWDHDGRDGKDGKDGNDGYNRRGNDAHFLRTGLRLGLRL